MCVRIPKLKFVENSYSTNKLHKLKIMTAKVFGSAVAQFKIMKETKTTIAKKKKKKEIPHRR